MSTNSRYSTGMEADKNREFPSPSGDKSVLDSGTVFTPKFGSDGLITAIAVDAETNDVLMVAYMNAEALSVSLKTGVATYWSRSRAQLWKKGETSGNIQLIDEVRTDCDQDAVILRVRTQDSGASCHTGRRSCFYRSVKTDAEGNATLVFDETDQPRFDPTETYK